MKHFVAPALLLTAVVNGCGSTASSISGTATTRQQICDEHCAKSGSKDICITKLEPYSDLALEKYEACKGDTKCIQDALKQLPPTSEGTAFGAWACTTCGLKTDDKLCDVVARSVSPFSPASIEGTKAGCEPKLKEAAAHPSNVQAACSAAVTGCFKVSIYTGGLCTVS